MMNRLPGDFFYKKLFLFSDLLSYKTNGTEFFFNQDILKGD